MRELSGKCFRQIEHPEVLAEEPTHKRRLSIHSYGMHHGRNPGKLFVLQVIPVYQRESGQLKTPDEFHSRRITVAANDGNAKPREMFAEAAHPGTADSQKEPRVAMLEGI
jgi:hypothetical protein